MNSSDKTTFFDAQICDELQAAVNIIGSIESTNLHTSVHELRKSLKRIRGWLRAVRPAQNAKSYNRELSLIGKEISDLRDSTSAIECFEILREKYGRYTVDYLFESMEKELISFRKRITQTTYPRMEAVRSRLEEFIQNYEPFKKTTRSELLSGIQNSYAVAQAAFENANLHNDPHTFHEWRKRNKDLQYQLLLFSEDVPYLNKLHEHFSELSGALGHDQDLYLFEAAVADTGLPAEAKDLLDAIASYEHDYSRNIALRKGAEIYRITPKTFARKLTSHIDETKDKK